MTCEPKPTGSAHHGQGAAGSGPGAARGDRMASLFRQRKAVYRLALIEGDLIEPDEARPQGCRRHSDVIQHSPPRVRRRQAQPARSNSSAISTASNIGWTSR